MDACLWHLGSRTLAQVYSPDDNFGQIQAVAMVGQFTTVKFPLELFPPGEVFAYEEGCHFFGFYVMILQSLLTPWHRTMNKESD